MKDDFRLYMKGKKLVSDPDDPDNIDFEDEWDESIDSFKDHIMYGSYDISDEDMDFSQIKTEIIDVYYTGPVTRQTPGIFLLKGSKAYYITGPTPVEAMKKHVWMIFSNDLSSDELREFTD